MRNVKICIVGPSKRFLSGISYYTIRLANALSTFNAVSAICFRKLLPEILFPGRAHVGKEISHLEFLPEIQVFDGMDYNNPITWFRAYRYLKKIKPDVVILQWWTSSVSHLHLLLKIMSRMLRSKLIIEFHEVIDPLEESILPLSLYSRLTGRLLRRNIEAFITHSESDKKLIAARYGINPGNIHVIPLGVLYQYEIIDKNTARKKLSLRKDFTILSFGLIRNYKGIPYLIKAFEELPEDIIQNSRLLIVGEIWEDRKELLDTINSFHLKQRITLIDRYVTDSEISLYFSAADIVVLPYLRASQSGIAHIAMTFGKPVVVSEVGGLKESMGNYSGAFFVPPANSEAIKEQLIKNFRSEKIYSSPAVGWDKISEQYRKVMSEIII